MNMIEIDDTILQVGKSPVASGDDPISKAFEEYWDKVHPNCMTILNYDEYLERRGFSSGYKMALRNVKNEMLKRLVKEENGDEGNQTYEKWIDDVIEKVDSDRYE